MGEGGVTALFDVDFCPSYDTIDTDSFRSNLLENNTGNKSTMKVCDIIGHEASFFKQLLDFTILSENS